PGPSGRRPAAPPPAPARPGGPPPPPAGSPAPSPARHPGTPAPGGGSAFPRLVTPFSPEAGGRARPATSPATTGMVPGRSTAPPPARHRGTPARGGVPAFPRLVPPFSPEAGGRARPATSPATTGMVPGRSTARTGGQRAKPGRPAGGPVLLVVQRARRRFRIAL